MAQNPSRLEENVKQLNWEKGALVLLKDQVERRGDRGKQVWLQNVEGKIQEINELTKEAAELKKGHNSNSWNARVRLNNRVIQLLKDVNVLKERGNANSESVERLLNEVVTNKPKKFSSGDLRSFTSNFSIKIGSGTFGKIYEGQFPNGVKVAVKVLSEKNFTEEIFTSEVSTTGKISHRCLVKLYGFCFEEDGMKALLYEYMSNGSLDKILQGKGLGIDWDKLYGIAIETAKGLSYLHDGCHVQIIHHDVKPSNILLDSNLSPKISDFGLAKIMNRDASHRTNTKTRGTPGYIAPEVWIPSSRITPKCDVYSFGVLLFEILKMGYGDHSIKWFPKQVWEKFHVGQLDEIIKECGIRESSRENARTLAMVALWCVQYTPQIRPTMSTVVMLLEKKIQVTSPPNPFVPSSESSVPPGEQRFPKSEPEPNTEKYATSQGSQSSNASSSNSILELFEKKCPLGGENSVILYTTTRRKSVFYQNCSEVLSILRSHQVQVVQRDYYGSGETMMELAELIGTIVLPALFVKGRYIGGAVEVKKMEADGTLRILFAEAK